MVQAHRVAAASDSSEIRSGLSQMALAYILSAEEAGLLRKRLFMA